MAGNSEPHDTRRCLHDFRNRSRPEVAYDVLILNVDPRDERIDEFALLIQFNRDSMLLAYLRPESRIWGEYGSV